jgi:hypothetical protein
MDWQESTRYRRSLVPVRTSQSDNSGHPGVVTLPVGSRTKVGHVRYQGATLWV